ncbi:hypothetical protein A7A08_00555 [Methyloligella halotolerans]|uniref:DUF2147 domain-containing protein n=1 Tax=Methyloligella halotolerans TaxID=1177755 RepID=A0A1E2S2I4_9HYPH|nr:hypothetical protein [Methyloligella halotolerans]ODA68723.1 hypothetical protein A7A08_00555 [Methyloligella halotolerans]
MISRTAAANRKIATRLSAFALAAGMGALLAVPSAHASRFDGSWDMLLQTTNGHCGKIKIDVAVTGGEISATGGRFVFHKIALGGHVGPAGHVNIKGIAGPRTAWGTGRFGREHAQGKWHGVGPSGKCNGVWAAERV